MFSLKRELKLKELIIIEKTAWAVKLERDADDAVRTSKENERAYEEVCELYVLCVDVLVKALRVIYGCDKGGYNEGYQVSVHVCLVYCVVLGRVPSRNKVPL